MTTATELSFRVMVVTLATVVPVAGLAAWFGGPSAGLGVLAAGALTVGNFLWLVRHAPTAGGRSPDRHRLLGWALSTLARLAVVTVAVTALLVTGWAHPLALVGGLTVFPGALVAVGLRSARGGAEDR